MRAVANREEAAYMKERQRQNKAVCKYSAAENWMAKKLAETPHEFTRQARWGYRLFDFWCHPLGMAIEVDGLEHVEKYDQYRDSYNWARSAIHVVRVRNFNENDADFALRQIACALPWPERKRLVKPGKKLVLAMGMEMARSPTARRRNGRGRSIGGNGNRSLGSLLDSVPAQGGEERRG